MGFAFLAMAAINQRATGWRSWAWAMMAGFATGQCVMEGADMGAMLSVFVGAYALSESIATVGSGVRNWVSAVSRLIVLVVCAGWIAVHTVIMLVDTSIIGVSGMSQGAESKAQRWAFATSWSFPPIETLRLAVPGLFGYRMDTPGGGAYWGEVGPDGTAQNRFSGDGEYAGALVILVAGLAILAAAKKSGGPLTPDERRRVWFFTGLAILTLLLSFGRFAPFYQAVFALPYFSTIRGPSKFLHVTHWALLALFAHGVETLFRLRIGKSVWSDASEAWRDANPLTRRWLILSIALVAGGTLAALVFTNSATTLDAYLDTLFPKPSPKLATAAFAIREAWIAVVFFGISTAAAAWVVLRPASQPRIDWALAALAAVLMADLVHANLPWIKYYDYRARYQSNVVIDLLRDHPWEHRVTAFIQPMRSGLFVSTQSFAQLQHEWLENHFPYYDIQSLDIDQMPRMSELDSAFLGAFAPGDPRQREALEQAESLALSVPYLDNIPASEKAKLPLMMPGVQAQLFPVRRMWELTNTRFILGWQGGLDWFNRIFDSEAKRFSIRLPYAVAPKPGVPAPDENTPVSEVVRAFTAVQNDSGPLAVLEFSGALPRARLFHKWEVLDGNRALSRLRSPEFDPAAAVVVSSEPSVASTDDKAGSAAITQYEPRRVVVETEDPKPSILLLNDHWSPHWLARVDGTPVPLLRANYLMRAVSLPAGKHTVAFQFSLPNATLWVSVLAFGIGAIVMAALVVPNSRKPSP